MLGHGGSSAGSYLADPTSPIPSHCAVIILFQSREWESAPNLNNKLKRVLPKLNENHTPKGMTRRDGTVCARLRIGHWYLTHCYLLKGEPQPFCVSCNEALTINHLLTNCAEFADSRRKHYSTNTLEEVLSSGNYAHVLSFLKEINLYKKV